MPDPIGDLIYNGVASDTLRSNSASGLQLDGSYKLNAEPHAARRPGATRASSRAATTRVGVFPTDDEGAQTATDAVTIVDNSSKTGKLYSLYLQDEWHITAPLTLNYGLRYDKVDAFTDEHQWSPRVNLSYKLAEDTALHAGYSRYFTPPPQELAAQSSIDLYANTSNAPAIGAVGQRQGRAHQLLRRRHQPPGQRQADPDGRRLLQAHQQPDRRRPVRPGADPVAVQLREGLCARAWNCLPCTADKHWGGYLNLATQKAMGSNIVSGQSLFDPDELAYIANHYIYLDHDQKFTFSGGAHYHFGDSQVSTDLLYGSGLRRPRTAAPPIPATLPSYTTMNFAFTHEWKRHWPSGTSKAGSR